MAIDTSAADVATSSLKSLPFGNIIGGPLVACVDAQAQAARTSWEFIQNVGLYTEGEEKKTVNAVSYTHLDVYKRQAWACPRARTACC